jgi:hypothetical protein
VLATHVTNICMTLPCKRFPFAQTILDRCSRRRSLVCAIVLDGPRFIFTEISNTKHSAASEAGAVIRGPQVSHSRERNIRFADALKGASHCESTAFSSSETLLRSNLGEITRRELASAVQDSIDSELDNPLAACN